MTKTVLLSKDDTFTFAGWILWQCTILCKVTKLWRKWQKIVKRQKIVTLRPQNCDSNVAKLCRYTKKVARIFLISWLCAIFRFSKTLCLFATKLYCQMYRCLVSFSSFCLIVACMDWARVWLKIKWHFCCSLYPCIAKKSLLNEGH